jgi:hypothetical protein
MWLANKLQPRSFGQIQPEPFPFPLIAPRHGHAGMWALADVAGLARSE